jgi:hypothetical protein
MTRHVEYLLESLGFEVLFGLNIAIFTFPFLLISLSATTGVPACMGVAPIPVHATTYFN